MCPRYQALVRYIVLVCGFVPLTVTGQSASEERLRTLEQKLEQLEHRVQNLENPSTSGVSERRSEFKTGNPRAKENWRALRRGMTEVEVKQLLGEPPKIESSIALIFWQWPTGGMVHFDVNSRRVTGWSEP